METHPSFERRLWLFSRRADFWLACGGASTAILAAVALILLRGDRELDALDFVLSEFHLGATYDAVIRRRLWRRQPGDVLAASLMILALTYGLAVGGHQVLLTSIAMYAAVWHRGRQSFGVARYYQRQSGGPVSRTHDLFFRAAIYLPMLAATLAFTHGSPAKYEGDPYLALDLGALTTALIGIAAALAVIVYVAWVLWQRRIARGGKRPAAWVHPGEWWIVLAHAAAFGSSYALGATNASFLLVLAVHHEIQYLYFTYAMARPPSGHGPVSGAAATRVSIVSFLFWPVLGFSGAVVGGALQLSWLAPLGLGGLFCHYWLDGRIWTRKAFQN
ncbi:MAG TPA: hypothetical protein VL754_12525 [Verrucomicrobiae bacterium]|nr:hypothetical protein [Verrucomicrobiae bacterium]